MLKFYNPAGYILILLYVAHCLNDVFTTPVLGTIPVTPVQVTILGSIFYLLVRGRNLHSAAIRMIFGPAYLYFIFIFISTLVLYIDSGQLELYVFTLGFNLLLLRLLAPYLYEGLSPAECRTFVLQLVGITMVLCVVPALYEFITRTNVLQTQKGLSANVFYVRGLFTDKIELGTSLAILIFILMLLFDDTKRTLKRAVIAGLALLALVLAFFSFSTTAIVGIVSGGIVLQFFKVRGIFIKTFVSILFIYLGYFLVSDTNLFEEQLHSYQLKYTLNVERYGESNFRYLSFIKGMEAFMEKPFFGNGVSQSQLVIQEVLQLKKQVNPHNLLVTELIDYGIIGTLFIGVFLYRLYKLQRVTAYNFSGYPHVDFMRKFTLALGIVVLFRLILYYHRFDQLIYFFWAALLIMTYGMMKKAVKVRLETISNEKDTHPGTENR